MMNRKNFIKTDIALSGAFAFRENLIKNPVMNIQALYFKDDGSIPNSKLPLLIYSGLVPPSGINAEWFEEKFNTNNWTNSWRWGVYPFHHYHSNTHEVLGVFSGNALLLMGGENGKKIRVTAGDVLVIPAGVGHKCIEHNNDFTVVGAYPGGLSPDLMRGEKGERPKADENIFKVSLPEKDPVFGTTDGLAKLWKGDQV